VSYDTVCDIVISAVELWFEINDDDDDDTSLLRTFVVTYKLSSVDLTTL